MSCLIGSRNYGSRLHGRGGAVVWILQMRQMRGCELGHTGPSYGRTSHAVQRAHGPMGEVKHEQQGKHESDEIG